MTRLFHDYLARRGNALSFFPGDWGDPADWHAAARRALAHDGPREEVVRVLTETNAAWLTPRSRARLEAVADGKGVAVVAGQQAGLLGGPLYTFHKALAVLRLADRIERQFEFPALPLFWVAANDSDLVEAGRTVVIDQTNTLRLFTLHDHEALSGFRGWPVGRVPLGPTAGALREWLDGVLHPTDFRDDLLAAVSAAYHPEATIGTAFTDLMGRWLGPLGLVFLDPLWMGLQDPNRDFFGRVLADPRGVEEVLAETGKGLNRSDYHQQLSMPPNRVPLFATRSGEPRRPLLPTDRPDRFEVEGAGEFPAPELLDPDGPWTLDPSAALRPLLQDHLLPTMVFVGGPAEVAYWAQLGPLYDRMGIPAPIVMPRPRVLLLPRVAARVLEKHRLTPDDLVDGPEALVRRLARQLFPADLEAAFERTREGMLREFEGLKVRVAAFDPTLEAPFETAAGRLGGELDRLLGKAVTNLGRQQETLQAQVTKAAAWIQPGRQPQERILGILPFALRHGLDRVLEVLADGVDPGRPEELQIVPLD